MFLILFGMLGGKVRPVFMRWVWYREGVDLAFGAGVFLDGHGCYRNIGPISSGAGLCLASVRRYYFKLNLTMILVSSWR